MNILMNVAVYGSDGLCGHSSHLIVNPTTKQVTHLVVKEKHAPHTEYMVPIDQVVDSTPDMIKLRCTGAGLTTMEPFVRTDIIQNTAQSMGYPTENFGQTGNLALGYAMFPHYAGERFTVMVKTAAVPNGEVAFAQGAHVYACDGQIGRLDGFLTVPATGQITHLVLREGHLWGKKDVTIPVTQIDHMQEENVYLKLDKQSIGALPTTPVRT